MTAESAPRDWLVLAVRYSRGAEGDAGAVWWRPEAKGYTRDLDEAGRFTEAEAKRHERLVLERGTLAYFTGAIFDHKAVPLEVARRFTQTVVHTEKLARELGLYVGPVS